MRFGRLPLDQALGAVLAHSLRLEELAFKKGRRLSSEDLAALRAAGREAVVAARLDADDVHEDEAARQLGQALAGPGVDVEAPFTGRVNLLAAGPGVLMLDPARIDALNLIDEAITLATLPAYQAVRPGQMVATVKIIPFAAPRARLDEALRIATAGPRVLEVARYRPLEVALIQTRLAGTKESVLDKTVSITAARVDAIGGRLIGEARSPHETEALAAQIRASRGDLLLIAGASAITDRKDVLPAAIEAAGGRILHFGMPVDPGNLLLLARIGERTVLGLPGCARSPKLNGFDWVLERLAAGVRVTPESIMRMGVGGLLTEIPTRPQPRAGGSAKPGRVAALVLAAGQSRRMGRENKLLAQIDGRPMVTHAIEAVRRSRASPVIVVTGHQADEVRAAIAGDDLTFVHNPDFAAGLSTSLKTGLAALPDGTEGVLILLGDMPQVTAEVLDRLIAAFNPTEGRAIVVPTVRGKRGNPVLFATRFVAEMEAIGGDVGARQLLGAHADEVVEIEMDDASTLFDVDTPAALQALQTAAGA